MKDSAAKGRVEMESRACLGRRKIGSALLTVDTLPRSHRLQQPTRKTGWRTSARVRHLFIINTPAAGGLPGANRPRIGPLGLRARDLGPHAQRRYEGRSDLGNTQPGDSRRYLGRGLSQTTGRANCRATRDGLAQFVPHVPDFEAVPALLERPDLAALGAAWYWHSRGLNACRRGRLCSHHPPHQRRHQRPGRPAGLATRPAWRWAPPLTPPPPAKTTMQAIITHRAAAPRLIAAIQGHPGGHPRPGPGRGQTRRRAHHPEPWTQATKGLWPQSTTVIGVLVGLFNKTGAFKAG